MLNTLGISIIYQNIIIIIISYIIINIITIIINIILPVIYYYHWLLWPSTQKIPCLYTSQGNEIRKKYIYPNYSNIF